MSFGILLITGLVEGALFVVLIRERSKIEAPKRPKGW